MVEIILGSLGAFLTILKIREHFIKYPIKKKKG